MWIHCSIRQGRWLHRTWKRVLNVFNVVFASVFISKTGIQKSQIAKTRGKGWIKEGLALVEQDQVSERVSKLDIHKFVRPAEVHPCVLRKPAGVIVRPLSIIFEQS